MREAKVFGWPWERNFYGGVLEIMMMTEKFYWLNTADFNLSGFAEFCFLFY
jgi:hypothetical protein